MSNSNRSMLWTSLALCIAIVAYSVVRTLSSDQQGSCTNQDLFA